MSYRVLILLTNILDHPGVQLALDNADVDSRVACLSNVPHAIEEQVVPDHGQLLVVSMIHSDLRMTLEFVRKMREKNNLLKSFTSQRGINIIDWASIGNQYPLSGGVHPDGGGQFPTRA